MKGLTVFLIIAVAIVVLLFLGWSRVPDMLANNLSKKFGVSTSIDSMHFGFSKIGTYGFEIGNPRGYTLPKAFSAKEIIVHAPLSHYFHDTIVIDKVEVNDIYLGLEFDFIKSAQGNWTKILSQFQNSARLDDKGQKMVIKSLVVTNTSAELLFRQDGDNIRKLPNIQRMEFTNITSEGGIPYDQLLGNVLAQMLREVFIQQNLNNMIKGLLLETPSDAIDTLTKPFKGLFNTAPKSQSADKKIA